MTDHAKTETQERATSDFSAAVYTMTADELKKSLAEQGLTQAQLAELVEVTEKTVSFWVTGKAPVPATIPLLFNLMRENKALRDELEAAKQRIVDHFFHTEAPAR